MLTTHVSHTMDEFQSRIARLSASLRPPLSPDSNLLDTCAVLLTLIEELRAALAASPTASDQASVRLIAAIDALLAGLEDEDGLPALREARYRAIVETQAELLCRFLPDGRLTFANTAYAALSGQPLDELHHQVFQPLLNEETGPRALEKITQLTAESPVFKIEQTVRLGSGRAVLLNWTCRGIFDSSGRLLEIQAGGQDITDRKLAEITASQRNRELSALHKATTALLTTIDLDRLLGQILDAAISAIPAAERGMLYLVARDTGQLEMRASVGFKDVRIQKLTNQLSRSYIVRAVQEQRPLLVKDLPNDPQYPQAVSRPSEGVTVAAIVSPLLMEGQVFGALALDSSQRAAFSEADLRLLASFAATATAAIRNAQLHGEVQKLALTDPLTGLYNRRGFNELGRREVERSRRFRRPLAAVMLDLDDFKQVNDRFGHAAGDQMLRGLADLLQARVRTVDILARIGGDEYILLLPETEIFAALNVAERLRLGAADLAIASTAGVARATVSIGLARLTNDTRDLEALYQRADAAMYAAKAQGGNRVVMA